MAGQDGSPEQHHDVGSGEHGEHAGDAAAEEEDDDSCDSRRCSSRENDDPVLSPPLGSEQQRAWDLVQHSGEHDNRPEGPGGAGGRTGRRHCDEDSGSDDRGDELDPPRPNDERAELPRLASAHQLADVPGHGGREPCIAERHRGQDDEGDVALPAHLIGAEHPGGDDGHERRQDIRSKGRSDLPDASAEDAGPGSGHNVLRRARLGPHGGGGRLIHRSVHTHRRRRAEAR